MPSAPPLDPSAAAVLAAFAKSAPPPYSDLGPIAAREAARQVRLARGGAPAPIETVRDIPPGPGGPPVTVRLYHPGGPAPLPALVYFHGGGWVVGDLDSHDLVCRQIAAGARIAVLSVDYPLAPEAPFPAAADAALAAWNWCASAALPGIDPTRIAIGGDSAGGNIAAVTANALRGGQTAPIAQVLIYPCTDLTMASMAKAPLVPGLALTQADMAWFIAQYLGDAAPDAPRASPLLAADLSGLPPTAMVMAGCDVLAPEGYAYADRLRPAGTMLELFDFPGQIHGFVSNPDCAPQTGAAIKAINQFLRALLCHP